MKLFGYEDEITKFTILKYEKLKAERVNWESHWQELVELIIPDRDTIYTKTAGEKKFTQVYDSGQIHANKMLASALHSRLTNPIVQWFSMATGDRKLDELKEVQQYLEDVTEKMHQVLNSSNFHTQVAEMYLDLCGICTSVLVMEEDDEDHVRFKASPIWDHFIDVNYKGLVDTVMTEYEDMTVRQLLQKFGETPFEGNEDKKYKLEQLKRDMEQKVTVVHAVFPREDFDPSKKSTKGMKFVSVQVLLECNVKLEEKGYYELPFLVSRFSTAAGEKHGRGPGTEALADIKMLQEMAKVTIRVAQKIMSPPLMVPDDAAYLPVKTVPDGINYYRAGSEDRIEYLESRGNVNISLAMIERVEKKIDQAFYVDQLKLSEERPRMSATESGIRDQQDNEMLSPVLSRQQYEFLRKLVERLFGILDRKGELPEPPEVLEDKRIKVMYSSQIAKAQKRTLLTSLDGFYAALEPIMALDESAKDVLDTQATARYAAEISDIPVKLIRSKEAFDKLQKQKAAEIQKQQEQEAMVARSQAAKNLQGPAEALAAGGAVEELIDEQ